MSETKVEEDEGENDTRFTGTVNITQDSDPAKDEQSQFTPILEQIVAREKENKAAVRKLQQIILNQRKKRVDLTVDLKSKEKGTGDLARQNKEADKAMKSALNELQKMTPEYTEGQRKVTQTPVEEDLPLLERLKALYNDLSDDVTQKENYLKNPPPTTKKQLDQTKELPRPDEKENELAEIKCLLNELKDMEKSWLKKLADVLQYEKSVVTQEKFAKFWNGIHRIIENVDSCLAAELEYDRLKDEKDRLTKKKNELHDKVEKRLQDRKSLELLPSKIRVQYEQIARNRGECQPLPAVQADSATRLEDLYNWGMKELLQGERDVKEGNREVKDAKEEGEHKERMRNLHKQQKDEEIQSERYQLGKLETENKNLRALLEKAKQKAEASNAKTVEICREIRTVIETNETQSINAIKARLKLEKDIEVEKEKERQMEETMYQIRKQKARQQEELNQLKRELSEQSKANAERNRCDQDKRKKLEHRLQTLLCDKETLMKNMERNKV